MSTHEEKAQEVAGMVMQRAEQALAGLDREMAIMKWRAEFRAIMWGAVADIATRRAAQYRANDTD